jgi:hypothetical protein
MYCIENFVDRFFHFLVVNKQTILASTPFILNYKSFKNLGESKYLKFDQNYRENYKKL